MPGILEYTSIRACASRRTLEKRPSNSSRNLGLFPTTSGRIGYRSVRTVYRGPFESVASDTHDYRTLNSPQRAALLAFTGAYSTASHVALFTIAGVLSVEFLSDERAVWYSIRIGKIAKIRNIKVNPNNNGLRMWNLRRQH